MIRHDAIPINHLESKATRVHAPCRPSATCHLEPYVSLSLFFGYFAMCYMQISGPFFEPHEMVAADRLGAFGMLKKFPRVVKEIANKNSDSSPNGGPSRYILAGCPPVHLSPAERCSLDIYSCCDKRAGIVP